MKPPTRGDDRRVAVEARPPGPITPPRDKTCPNYSKLLPIGWTALYISSPVARDKINANRFLFTTACQRLSRCFLSVPLRASFALG